MPQTSELLVSHRDSNSPLARDFFIKVFLERERLKYLYMKSPSEYGAFSFSVLNHICISIPRIWFSNNTSYTPNSKLKVVFITALRIQKNV